MSNQTAKKSNSSNADKKAEISKYLIDLIEKTEVAPWRCPWIFGHNDMAFKGSEYNGINQIVLALVRTLNGFKSRLWLTKTKINALNDKVWVPAKGKKKAHWAKVGGFDKSYSEFAYIKADSKAAPVIYWNWYTPKDALGNPQLDANGNEIKIPYLSKYCVFNADQIENFDPTPFEPELPDTGIDACSCQEIEKMLLAGYKDAPKVVHGGDRACYNFELDTVCLPDYKQFLSVQEFAAALAHELVHSTGAKTRLKRNMSADRRSTAYSKEELVAEFGASMLMAELGYKDMPTLENSAAYLKSWISELKNEPTVLFDAIRDARKATDHILGIVKEEASDSEEETISAAV